MAAGSDRPHPATALLRRMRARAREAQGEELMALAAGRGLLDDDQRAALEAHDDPLAEAVARGWLTAAGRAELESALARQDFARGLAQAPGALPAEVATALAGGASTLAELVLVEQLGAGGAGEVWKAWDRSLGRWVAVKRPRAALAGRDDLERLQREAVAAARVDHPGLLPIHRVGSDGGRPYLVMPFVAGTTLDRAALTPPRAVAAIRDAALALDTAHRAGLVHRDVKPSNLMLGDDGRLWVLDFGLAHLIDAGPVGETRAGVALGTAAYMSPEQAAGSPASRAPATDIYGLGATLYHLVTGAPPFEGADFAEVTARVRTTLPVPPRRRRRQLSRDLETVILRAMASSPADRYPSAAALAEDLGRVLEDRPIRARRSSPIRELERGMRSRPRVSAAALTALLAVTGAVLWLRQQALDARAGAVESVRQLARLSLATALALRRAGDVKAPRRLLPELEAAYATARARAPSLAEPDHLLGRLHRALMDEERALQHQERALALEPGFAPARYERLVLLSRRFGRVLNRRVGTSRAGIGPGVGAPAWERLDAATLHDHPELGRLRAAVLADATALAALAVPQAQAQTVRGIVAAFRQDFATARGALERAIALDPLADEAWESLATNEEAAGRLAVADATYGRALAIDRGYLPFLVGRCRVRLQLDPAGAIEDASAALAADAGLVSAVVCRGVARLHLGHQAMLAGGNARGMFDDAERDFSAALGRDGDLWGALWGRGTLRRYRAHDRVRFGEDPLPDLAAAEADLARASAAAPRDRGARNALGRTRMLRGFARMRAGQDPGPDLDAAATGLRAALAEAPDRAASEWLGDLEAHRGLHLLERGDPSGAAAAFARADDALAGAFGRTLPWAWHTLAVLRAWQGRAAARTGGDPLPRWAQSEADLGRAIALAPTTADFRWRRAQLRLERADHLAGRGGADLAAAAADLEQALALNPRAPEAWAARAALRRRRGDHVGARADAAQAAVLAPLRRFKSEFIEP